MIKAVALVTMQCSLILKKDRPEFLDYLANAIRGSEFMNALDEAVKFSARRLVDTNKTGQF